MGLFGRTTEQFAEVPHVIFHIILYLILDSGTFGWKLEFAEILLDQPLSAPLNVFFNVTFLRINSCSLKDVGNLLNAIASSN